jgi:DNA-directed RNA polymerase subunit RPC12/RpoP
MGALKIVGYIFAAVLILFGVLFILAAFGETWNPGWAVIGGILLVVGFGVILVAGFVLKKPSSTSVQNNTTLEVNLPGDVDVERFKCQDCGAQLTMDNVKMVAGAPMVDCPYCGAAYQLTEKPKW